MAQKFGILFVETTGDDVWCLDCPRGFRMLTETSHHQEHIR